MLSQHEIMQTIQMIDQQHLDVRTITMGISLLSCARSDPKQACGAIYDKITRYAEKLVSTGEAIEKEFGIPIVNKRISVTPIALVAAAAGPVHHRPGVRQRQRGLHQGGHRHGRGGPYGPHHQGPGRPHRRPGRLRLRQAGGVLQRGGGQPLHGRRLPRGGRAGEGHQRGGLRPRRGVPRPPGGEGAALRRGGRDHQKDRLPHHPHGPAGGPGGQPPAGHPLRHRGPVPGPHPRHRGQRGPHPGGDGPGGVRHPRHHPWAACPAPSSR